MRWLHAMVFTASLLIVGCGSGSDAAVASTADDDRPQSFEDLNYQSPIGDFLGQSFGGADSADEFEQIQQQADVLVAECMINLGFEYHVGANDTIIFGIESEELPYFSDEWVAKYGFGVSTQRFSQSSVGSDLIGFDDAEMLEPPSPDSDPNFAYMESLSAGERDEYQRALYGDMPLFGGQPSEEEMQEFFENRQNSGCQDQSFQEAFGGNGPGDGLGFSLEFGDELEAMSDRVESDSRVVAFRRGVSECVAEAGMTWTDEEDLYERFESRLNGLGSQRRSEDPFEAADLDPEEMSQREIQDFVNELNVLGAEDRAILAELQAEEIALAQVVVGCGGGPLNEQYELSKIRVEYEQRFLDENAERLEPFKAE